MGECKLHFGKAPSGIKRAAISVARSLVDKDGRPVMGSPEDGITAQDALTRCVEVAAGEVSYCTWRIEQLTHADAAGPVRSKVIVNEDGEEGHKRTVRVVTGPPDLHVWIKARHAAMDRLARFAKMALDAGVDERRVKAAEQVADAIAQVAKGMMLELGLTPEQERRLPEIMQRRLLLLEGGADAS